MRHAIPALLALLTLAACGDDSGSGGDAQGGAGAGLAQGGAGSGANGSGAAGQGGAGGTGATGGAPPCTATTLAEAARVTSIAIDAAAGARAITAERPGGSVVAWAAADGTVHVTPLDAVDQRAGADLTTSGDRVFGVAASASEIALLVSRPPDYMTFRRLDAASGSELSSVDLVGGGDHATIGVEWFGEFAQTGRLVRAPDGTFAAYHALHRRWPDNIGHQGDTLRLFSSAGAPAGGGWDWGCSHSMDQRLVAGPSGLVPICIADCYPGKGIYLNHDQSQITDDPAANCAGGYTTLVGGLVADASGFFLVYQDDTGGAHLGRFDLSGQAQSDRALNVPGSSRLARYGDGLLLGSAGGAGTSLQPLDASGADSGAPADVAAPLPDQDFESRSDGEVAWASSSGGALTVVRVRQCP